MEPSRFATLVQEDAGAYVAFSHTTGRLTEVSPDTFRFLAGDRAAEVTDADRPELARCGLLVASRDVEYEQVKGRLNALRHETTVAHYSIVLTYACNLRCPYCYEQAKCRRNAHMTKATALAVVDHIAKEGTAAGTRALGLTLYGGEPMLNLPAAYAIVSRLQAWARQHEVRLVTNLISNGTRITGAALRPLLPSLRTVQLTLDGARAHHNAVRIGQDGRGTFDRILESADMILGLGINLLFRIQLTPDSAPELDACLQELRARGFLGHPRVGVYVFPILDVGGVCSANAFRCYPRYFNADAMRRLDALAADLPSGLFHPPRPVWEQPYCSFVNAHAWIIDPSGDKYKCVSMLGRREYCAGAVAGDPPADAASRAACAAAFVARTGLDIDACRTCECLPTCDGGCGFRALCATGSFAAPSCEMHRETVVEQILAARRHAQRRAAADGSRTVTV